jgi:protein-disulfide isomerase
MMRQLAGVVMLGMALGLAGCGSNSPPLSGGLTSEATAGQAPGAAFPATTGSTRKEATFNPFEPHSGPIEGGREVIANPTIAEVMRTGTLPEMSLGRADAPVTIIKYASLTCPYCKRFHAEVFPQLKREYIDTGKVRFIIREFPIGQASGNATIAWRCASPAKFFDLYGKFLAQQANWVSQEVRLDAIHAVAAQVGLTRPQFDACLKDEALIGGLKWIKDRGRTLGIIGTPNFFVQGKLVKKVLTMDEIRAMVEPLLAGGRVAEKG